MDGDSWVKVGEYVTWDDEDEDVPEGHVGEVTGWRDNERVHIQFPNGNWHFPINELSRADKPKRKREDADGSWRLSVPQSRLT